jgi:hypothetical protein
MIEGELDEVAVFDNSSVNTGENSQKARLNGTKYVSMPTEEVSML